jgi:beta-galactosidase
MQSSQSTLDRRQFRPILALLLSIHASWALGPDREATPCVVDPALRSEFRQCVSLDGDWQFAIDPSGAGERQEWFMAGVTMPNKMSLHVPACWEAPGVGGPGESSPSTPEQSHRMLRGSYVGAAWYRKELTLPGSWNGKQIWLKIGGVHAQGWFWVNGVYVGHNACYCGSYKYNITDLVKPGHKVLVAAKVRNDVPSRKGLMAWIDRFGGIYRSVELDATPDLLIDDAYVIGDLDHRQCITHIKLRNTALENASQAKIEINISQINGASAGGAQVVTNVGAGSTLDLILPIPLSPFAEWSPEHPNLYRADILLKVAGQAVDGWVERFGVRKWEARGGNFYLNNHKFLIRGYGDDFIYPLTLVSPASRDIHRQHLQLLRSYGFNYVRHHTHCELPEFYEAADELGIMVQPELPYEGATAEVEDPGDFDPKADLTELWTHYRRYVSLSTYSMGNEGLLGSPLDRQVYQLAKHLDPTRLVLHQDGGQNRKDNSDFHQGPVVPWIAGTQDASWPFDAHEYMNLATEEDPRLARQYTGALLPPVTPQSFQAILVLTCKDKRYIVYSAHGKTCAHH